MFVVAIVRHVAAEDVGERAVGIGTGAEKLVGEVVVVVFDERIGDVVVDGVLADEQEGSDDGGDDEVDPAGVVGVLGGGLADGVVVFAADGVGEASLVEDGGFTHGANLGLRGVDGGPEEGTEAAVPVGATGAELLVTASRVILNLDVSGDGTLHGMPYVVNGNGVAVVPAVHVELIEGGPVIGPEGLIEEDVAVVLIGRHDADAILERAKGESLEDEALPVVRLLLGGGVGGAGLGGEERELFLSLRR